MKIGIAIITKDRNDIIEKVYEHHRKLTYWDRFIIIDDQSKIPVNIKDAEVIRPDKWLGVAGARNFALNILKDYDYVILMDDDVIPKYHHWVQDMVNNMDSQCIHILTGIPIRKTTVIGQISHGILQVEDCTGCLFVMDQVAIKMMGGFDTSLGKYGHEDTDYYERAKRAALVPLRGYYTIRDCEFMLHFCDFYGDYQDIVWPHESALGDAKWELINQSRERLNEIIKDGNNPIYKSFTYQD